MTWLVAHLEVLFGVVLALFTVLLLVQQRRSPQSTAAWLLLVILVPYAALTLFVLVAIRKPGGVAQLEFPDDTHGGAGLWTEPFVTHAGLPPASEGNRLTFLTSGDQAFEALSGIVTGAETSIEAEFYIVDNDTVGKAFVNLLAERARQGVRVRLVIDRFGGISRPRGALGRLREAGGEVCFSSPFLGLPGRGRLNLRNHRKIVIADGVKVFAGGMNVGEEYMATGPGAQAKWTDLAFLLEGPAAADFRAIVASDIANAGGSGAAPGEAADSRAGDATVQVVPSGPDVHGDPLHDTLVAALFRAERRAWIVTPYFLPTDHLAHALMVAAGRGIDTRLLVPAKSNQILADLARGSYLRNFQDAGGTIHRLEGRMIHAKAGVIDDMAWVGSANLDVRSMYLNFETVLFLHDAASVAEMSRWMERQLAGTVEGLPHTTMPRRIAEGAFRLATPVL